jgi:hypothetical protein
MREQPWTPAEFELLLASPLLSDDHLAKLIQTRGPGAVAAVRQGVHANHTGGSFASSSLSQMMKSRLEAQPRVFKCCACDEEV